MYPLIKGMHFRPLNEGEGGGVGPKNVVKEVVANQPLTLQSCVFFFAQKKKSKDTPKKARISLSAEPLKSQEKKGKNAQRSKENRHNEKSKENEKKNKDWRVRDVA